MKSSKQSYNMGDTIIIHEYEEEYLLLHAVAFNYTNACNAIDVCKTNNIVKEYNKCRKQYHNAVCKYYPELDNYHYNVLMNNKDNSIVIVIIDKME